MTTNTGHSVFLNPLDTLVLRGNKLFGDPGSFGEALMPPWPSVAAGAIRSHLLARDGVDLLAYGRGEIDHPALGTPARPGSFQLTAFHLARRSADGRVEVLFAPPADLVLHPAEPAQPTCTRLQPTRLAPGLASSNPLPTLAVLPESERHKPTAGYWLRSAGWQRYLDGALPQAEDWVPGHALWQTETRPGVGLDPQSRAAADGHLYTVEVIALRPDVGFAVALSGVDVVPAGMLRFGGDGHGAALAAVAIDWPQPDYARIAADGRCRLVLTTPGVFASSATEPAMGWLPTGSAAPTADGARFELHGVRGRIVCAAVARGEVVSGWDLARREPKSAQRVAPTGSVWWLELASDVSPSALHHLVERGLMADGEYADHSRRAEGYNRCTLAVWSHR